MPRYVILRHENPHGVHFDFMLEFGDVLKTWALPHARGGRRDAVRGPGRPSAGLSRLRGAHLRRRGAVTRWDGGTYALQRQSDAEWVVELAGVQVAGVATIRHLPETPGGWVFLLAGKVHG